MQFHAGHTLEVGCQQIDGNGPITITEFGSFHDSTGLEAELRAIKAVTAAMGHTAVLDVRLNIEH